jgi:cytochrome P450 family 6
MTFIFLSWETLLNSRFETSSTTIQMALYELAYRPKIQERLREEITKVLEKYNGEMTYESLAEMTYLDQVVNGSF